jgi:putative Mg2+ transporter-C (MgtC) family protein
MGPLLAEMAVFRDTPDLDYVVLIAARLTTAAVLGALLGIERQCEGKPAGTRMHMLVALGAAVFTLTPQQGGGISDADLSRVIQGVAAGVGFLGAGTILKADQGHKVEGLTTAADIWLTAAVGMTVGAGFLWPALVSAFLGLIILDAVHRVERWVRQRLAKKPPDCAKEASATQ